MNKKNITPRQSEPVVRPTPGTQTDLLSELSEEVLGTISTSGCIGSCLFDPLSFSCSFEGEDAE